MSDRRFYAAKKAHQLDEPEDTNLEPSKTERKREAHAARDLGEELCVLSDEQLSAFPLSDSLLAAIRESRNIKAHGARKRHLQFIGKLMRQHDVAAIEQELNRIDPDAPHNIRLQHESERWRERLLSEDTSAITDFISNYPQVDIQALRQLLRLVAKERAEQKPPRYFRELFRLVRDTLSQVDQPADDTVPD
jgi:ribosome-associated protein